MRGDCASTSWYRNETGTRSSDTGRSISDFGASTVDAMGSVTANAWELMVRMPLQMTAAGLQWMTSGVQRMGGQGGSSVWPGGQKGSSPAPLASEGSSSQSAGGSSWSSWANPANWVPAISTSQSTSGNQDLSGSDLKYIVWSIVFTKPGHEAVLEPQQSELINYSTDVSSFAALKIAKCLERGRFGKLEKPANWIDRGYPPESAAAARRSEGAGGKTDATSAEKGWRIPSEDQKYVQFLYRVEWRLPKEEPEVSRVERVTIERAS